MESAKVGEGVRNSKREGGGRMRGCKGGGERKEGREGREV